MKDVTKNFFIPNFHTVNKIGGCANKVNISVLTVFNTLFEPRMSKPYRFEAERPSIWRRDGQVVES